MYKLIFALLVKMQIELASHLKRQRCENCKENIKCLTIIKELEQTKLSKYWTCLSD